jgi:glycosyltransferase involved in cell wall biosynthesis
MKALLLTHNLRDRGSYFRAYEIGRRLAQRGHVVDFGYVSEVKKYRPSVAEELWGRGVLRRIEFPHKTLFNDRQEGWGLFDIFWRLLQVFKERYDFGYAFSHKPDCILPFLLGRPACSKFVLDWSDWWSGPEGLFQACVLTSAAFQSLPRPQRLLRRCVFGLEQWWEPRVWRVADAVTLISSEFFQHPAVAPEELRQKAYVMHSGAPLEHILPRDKQEARRRCRLSFPAEAVVFGYVANFHTDEQLLLEAFARLLMTRKDAFLLVVGSDFEATSPAVHESIKHRLLHVGRKPFERIGDYLAAADVLLLPLSDIALNRARYPHKLSDYVAAGRPLVACDVGETGRLLARYHIGLLTEPTAYGFSKGMQSMIELKDEWENIGAQVREAAEKYFSWDRLCEGLFSFLEERLSLSF